LALALVRDLREHRTVASAEELADFETDVLAGFVLARASAGLADSTIRNDTGHLELIRDWFGRPLWEMQPSDADTCFGKVLREAKPSTRTGRAAALTVYFQFLELRHKIELHNLTGRVIECPLDEMNRPRTSVGPQLRIPPAAEEIEQLFAGWRAELATCRKFAPAARNYAAARLAADVGLRINEARLLDLDDVRWELGRFGKLNVRHGKGSRRRGPKPRLVPLINGADRNLRWFVEDVWGQFDADHARPGAPLFPSERKSQDGSCPRATADVFRRSLAEAATRHLPALGEQAHPARAAALLRLPALPRGHEPVRHPGATRPRLDGHHRQVYPRSRHPCGGRMGRRAAARR
jgi:integrase